MSMQNIVNIEKRRGRPKGSTNGISKKKYLSNKAPNITPPHNPNKDCVCDLSDQPLPTTRHLDSCTGTANSDVATVDPGACPVIINLEDDDTDAETMLAAHLSHSKFLQETDLKPLRETDSNVPPPGKRGRKKTAGPYNPKSFASDNLRAAGRHPALPPLNWHLLQKK
jgi:hypothetical protein